MEWERSPPGGRCIRRESRPRGPCPQDVGCSGACDSMLTVTEQNAPARADATRAMRSLERAFLLGVPGVTEILLIRHGDAYEGLDVLLDGSLDSDPGLSPSGREQARRLAERLGRLGVDAVYSSPL